MTVRSIGRAMGQWSLQHIVCNECCAVLWGVTPARANVAQTRGNGGFRSRTAATLPRPAPVARPAARCTATRMVYWGSGAPVGTGPFGSVRDMLSPKRLFGG